MANEKPLLPTSSWFYYTTIVNGFNKYYVNVGADLARKIRPTDNDYKVHIENNH